MPSNEYEPATPQQSGRESIAIIGIGCRYPGAANAEELWQNLLAGRESIVPYPGGRFAELDGLYERVRNKSGRLGTDRGGFLTDVAGFDSQFFEISPRESIYVDPQHRLLMEVAWEALEDAGQVRADYENSATGVYLGLWTNEYEARLYESATPNDFYSVTGCGRASASGRLSFVFGLQGPSVTIDTACSSSLVAAHMACQDLWAGNIDMALAGGANLILGPEISELFTAANMLSPEGSCKFGDDSASGFVRSEGAGIVVLKRLSRAIADHDPIYAVIRGGAVNNDGRSSGFLVTPSRAGQQEMLRAAWKSAGVEAKDIRYIEMHGTGTRVGDPIEIGAVGDALAEAGVTQPCALGSIKSNIGHTETAAGVAGLIKAALTLKYGMVPASLHFNVPNSKIEWDRLPVRVAAEAFVLESGAKPVLVGVSSFGLSGTNAHLVLEEARRPEAAAQPEGPYLLPLSARSPEALDALLRAHLETMRAAGQDYPLRDVCYTASARRTHHEYRVAIIAGDLPELEQNLMAAVAREDRDGVIFGRASAGQATDQSGVTLVAPGQGSQWVGMAAELFEGNPVFRNAFEQCDTAIRAETGWSLIDRILGADAEEYLTQIDVIQPALFAMSVALAAVWCSWGMEPNAVVGHSMGEVAAAHIAGILNLTDAVAVICRRSRLMKTLRSAGAMATVELPLAEVEKILQPVEGVSVAASNGPHTTVISGDAKSIEALLRELAAKDVYCRHIKVDVASHSSQVDPILADLFVALSEIHPQPAAIPMLSTVTGKYAEPGAAGEAPTRMDAAYWVENLRHSVLFAPAIQKLCGEGKDVFVELSPHPILLPAIEASAREVCPRALAVPSLRRDKPAQATLLAGLGTLYVSGRKIDWKRLYPAEARCVRLPQYPFQRERCWPEPSDPSHGKNWKRDLHDGALLGHRFESSLNPNALLWETDLEIARIPYLNDHRVLRAAVFPASAHIVMALSAAREMFPDEDFEVRDAVFLSAAYIPDTGAKTFQLALTPAGDGSFGFAIRSRGDQGEAEWPLRSQGVLQRVQHGRDLAPVSLAKLQQQLATRRSSAEHYIRTARSGLQYGPAFQRVEEVWAGESECLCRLRADLQDGSEIHPTLLDACFQAMAHIRPELEAFRIEDTYLPVSIRKICVCDKVPAEGDLYSRARLVEADAERGTLRADLELLDANGNLVAQIVGMELQRVAREERDDATNSLYQLEWRLEEGESAQRKAEAAVALLSRLSAENWVIFADDTGIAKAMQQSLEVAGGRCCRVRPGPGFQQVSATEFEVNPGRRADLEMLFDRIATDRGVPTAVVHLWSLDNDVTSPSADKLMAAQATGSQSIPQIVQAIAAADWQKLPRLWLVTSGAMPVATEADRVRIENAPLWGIGRSIAREHPELRPTLVDLSFRPDATEAGALALRICADGKEDRIAFRGSSTYVARFVPFVTTMPEVKSRALGENEQYRFEIASTGILENLALHSYTPPRPRAGEVTLEVVASGLNFIDVTKVMGIYPGLDPADPIQLGIECAGRITAIGEGVRGLAIGEEVLAITPSMRTTALLASAVTLPANMVLYKPKKLSMEEAATTPIAFLTAYYSLVELGHIRRGDWILIHSASGGVGLAAIEIAKEVGANIIATVGSAEKEAYIRSLGVTHVFSSRSVSFAAGVIESTNGQGVDIVLNSLTGELQSKGLEVLAPYGRFIELGKRDIYDDRSIGLKVFRKNLSFHAVDLAAAIEEKPSYVIELLRTVVAKIEEGLWHPLPVQSFSASEPSAPFRYMAQARHIGKIAVRMDRNVLVLPASGSQALFSSDGTYLITGGLGGVALTVAEWMARNGAGHLVLLSRREPSPESEAAIRRMEQNGTTVVSVRADITRKTDLARVLDSIHSAMPPLKGIMHTAAVVDDALVKDLSPERFVPVMMPKLVGAWNLHEATLEEELDFFVLFSSIGAVHPQPGMGSYAAANAFLDAFAYYRRALGKPAISVNWGGWGQIGLARAAGTGRSIDGYMQEGMRVYSAEEALEALRQALENNPAQMVAVPIDADTFAHFYGPDGAPPAFSDLMSRTSPATDTSARRSEIVDSLAAAESAQQRQEILESYLQETLGKVLKLATSKIDRERPLGSMGLDSLMGLEFVRRLSTSLQIAVPATVVFNYPTIQQMATHLLRKLQWAAPDEPSAARAVDEPLPRGKESLINTLSDGLTEDDAVQALMSGGQRDS